MQPSYKNLTNIPIFLGLSDKELDEITRNTRFNLRHHKKGSYIVEEGEACSALVSVVEGWMDIETYANNHSYHLEERVQAVQTLEPDKLFGLSPHYLSSCKAHTTCESISISKEELTLLFEKYIIIRINYLNLICRRTQIIEQQPWQQKPKDLCERIVTFVKSHSRYPAGRKMLYIKMAQLAEELNTSRLEISNALNALNTADKIILHRGVVEIPALQLL